MAKELRCSDVGFTCEATVRADTEDDVMAQVARHARDVHGLSDEDLRRQDAGIRAAVRDV